MNSRRMLFAIVIATVGVLLIFSAAVASPGLTSMEQLGKSIFFDTNLSINHNQSCATCHDPD